MPNLRIVADDGDECTVTLLSMSNRMSGETFFRVLDNLIATRQAHVTLNDGRAAGIFLLDLAGQRAGLSLAKGTPMPTATKPLAVTILDWGEPGKPMMIKCEDTCLILELPDNPKVPDQRCMQYATYQMQTAAGRKSAPIAVHLGFYGYLRVANAMCLQKAGMSIFDLGDAPWRDAYDNQRPPQEAVEEVLAEEGFPSGEE